MRRTIGSFCEVVRRGARHRVRSHGEGPSARDANGAEACIRGRGGANGGEAPPRRRVDQAPAPRTRARETARPLPRGSPCQPGRATVSALRLRPIRARRGDQATAAGVKQLLVALREGPWARVLEKRDIEPSFEEFAKLVPANLMKCSGEVFYSGRAAFSRPSLVYFVGINPGSEPSSDNPSSRKLRTVEENIEYVRTQPEHFSLYYDKWEEGRARLMQEGVQHLFANTDLVAVTTPASNCIFVRTSGADKLQNKRELKESCWPFHQAAIDRLGVKLILCLGDQAGRIVKRRLEARRQIDQQMEDNNRGWGTRVFRNPAGMIVIVAPHPSRSKWSTPACDPSPIVNRWLGEVRRMAGESVPPMRSTQEPDDGGRVHEERAHVTQARDARRAVPSSESGPSRAKSGNRSDVLPSEVEDLFRSAAAGGYKRSPGTRKEWITLDGRSVGGWDDRLGCWYISKVRARGHEQLLRSNKFRWQDNNNGHQWWRLDGVHNAPSFQTVVETITRRCFGGET